MLRISELRNTPVIVNQIPAGVLHSISMDMEQKRVCALSVSCGLRGRRLVLPEDVLSITNEFILARNIRRYKQPGDRDNARFIRDSTGILVGFVTDYAISEQKMEIEAVEMRIGFLRKEYAARIWVLDFICPPQKEELIVPASLGCELIYSAGRNA